MMGLRAAAALGVLVIVAGAAWSVALPAAEATTLVVTPGADLAAARAMGAVSSFGVDDSGTSLEVVLRPPAGGGLVIDELAHVAAGPGVSFGFAVDAAAWPEGSVFGLLLWPDGGAGSPAEAACAGADLVAGTAWGSCASAASLQVTLSLPSGARPAMPATFHFVSFG